MSFYLKLINSVNSLKLNELMFEVEEAVSIVIITEMRLKTEENWPKIQQNLQKRKRKANSKHNDAALSYEEKEIY